MPLPSIGMRQFLDYDYTNGIWRQSSDVPTEWIDRIFVDGGKDDYITPIEKGKEWLLALTCEHQPRTGKLLMEGSELIVRLSKLQTHTRP